MAFNALCMSLFLGNKVSEPPSLRSVGAHTRIVCLWGYPTHSTPRKLFGNSEGEEDFQKKSRKLNWNLSEGQRSSNQKSLDYVQNICLVTHALLWFIVLRQLWNSIHNYLSWPSWETEAHFNWVKMSRPSVLIGRFQSMLFVSVFHGLLAVAIMIDGSKKAIVCWILNFRVGTSLKTAITTFNPRWKLTFFLKRQEIIK